MNCIRCNAEKSYWHDYGAVRVVECRSCGFAWMPELPAAVIEKNSKAVPA